jgi:Protein of unknown function (DUF1569)
MPTPTRRNLHFPSFQALLTDAHLLHSAPYQKLGNWSLAQIADHLAQSLHASIDGFGYRRNFLFRAIARQLLPRILRTRRIPTGTKIPQRFNPSPTLTDNLALPQLTTAIQRFENHTAPLAPHPFFGTLTPTQWRHLHLIHAAHHLSFLIPTK